MSLQALLLRRKKNPRRKQQLESERRVGGGLKQDYACESTVIVEFRNRFNMYVETTMSKQVDYMLQLGATSKRFQDLNVSDVHTAILNRT